MYNILSSCGRMSTYYQKTTQERGEEIQLYRFNNFVKRYLYQKYVKKGDRVLELAGGRGGDIGKIMNRNVDYVLFTNRDLEALEEAKRRLIEIQKRTGKKLNIDFVELDFLNANLPKKLDKWQPASFDVISSQFAFHYALRDMTTFKNIVGLIDYFLKSGGYFIITSFDGELVYQRLNLRKSKNLIFNIGEKTFAEIKKAWTGEKEMQNLGQAIDVFVEKIGVWHQEYLVNFRFLTKYFEKMGYKIVEEENFVERLKTYRDAKYLTPAEKEYIRLHKYLVLQKGS